MVFDLFKSIKHHRERSSPNKYYFHLMTTVRLWNMAYVLIYLYAFDCCDCTNHFR